MKKNYILLALVMASSLIFAQSKINQSTIGTLSSVKITNEINNLPNSTLAKKAVVDSLHYDGNDESNAVGTGTNGAATLEAHAFFPAAQLSGHNANGNTITSVKVYINGVSDVTSTQLKFYSDQSTMVYSQAFTPIEGWNNVVLTTPFAIPTTDLYVGYECVMTGGFPMGCDAGPETSNGNWVFTQGQWTHLTNLAASLTYNWHIRAMIDGIALTTPDVLTTATPAEYTVYPLSQAANIVGDANLQNIGGGDATGATVTVNVVDLSGPTVVYTETSAAATITAGNNVDYAGFTGYVPTMAGDYGVQYIASINEADNNMNNDTTYYIVQVDDSVYARDRANITGVTGIAGVGTGQGGQFGNMFNVLDDDTLTGVQAFIYNLDGQMDGQDLIVNLYSWTGTASTLMASTVPVALNSATNANTMHELVLDGGSIVLGPGMYILGAVENDSNLSCGTTPGVYTVGGSVVNATGFTPDFVDISSVFPSEIVPVVRAVFGTPDMQVGIAENTTTNFEVFPNPAVENITVKNALGTTIEIYNNLGQVVYSNVANNNKFNVNVSSFDNGIYTIKSISGENTTTQSFVKQ
jgi:hypothetical protein